jgi:hypothetical protein
MPLPSIVNSRISLSCAEPRIADVRSRPARPTSES